MPDREKKSANQRGSNPDAEGFAGPDGTRDQQNPAFQREEIGFESELELDAFRDPPKGNSDF